MENKIEVGEYVRLARNQGINKIVDIDEGCYELEDMIGDEYGEETWNLFDSNINEEVVKHSKNIIDLIEVGDYVNGQKVKHISVFEGFPDYPVLIFSDEVHLLPNETCENKKIKSILTHEQMEVNQYVIE